MPKTAGLPVRKRRKIGDGDVDFPAVRQVLLDSGFDGWCTVEQDCDPTLDPDPIGDAGANRAYLESIGFS